MSGIQHNVTVVRITSLAASNELDDFGGEEQDDHEEDQLHDHEMKYTPSVVVKTEVPDDDCSNDDDFGNTDNLEDDGQRAVVRRSKRSCTLRRDNNSSVDDEDGKDGDWQPDEEDDWDSSKKSKKRKAPSKRPATRKNVKKQTAEKSTSKSCRKKISEMTPEEAERERARWRAKGEREKEKRRLAAEKNNAMEESDTGGSGPGKRKRLRICEMAPEQAERERARLRAKRQREKERKAAVVKCEASEQSDASCAKIPGGRRKKRVSEMTPEELESYREKERLRSRRRREREKNIADPEKRKEMEEKYAAKLETLKLKRAMAREGALPKEDLARMEEQKRKDRERRQAKRAAMDDQQRREELQRNRLYKLNLMARLSEEEKIARRNLKYFKEQARLAEMDSETRKAYEEKKRVRNREAAQRKAAQRKMNPIVQDEETLRRLRERKRDYWHNMQPERKAVYLEKLRDYHKKKMESWKETGEWEQIKERMRERGRLNQRRRRELGLAKNYKKPKGKGRVLGVRAPKKKLSDLSEEEKEIVRQRRREYKTRRKLAMQKLLDMGMSFEEIQQRTETPEQREHRIIRKRIQKAKSTLRQQLERQGASDQEIQRQCEHLKQTYEPVRKFRPYKPQPDKWKPPDPEEVAKLKAEGLDNVDNLKPLSMLSLPTTSLVKSKRHYRRRTTRSKQQVEKNAQRQRQQQSSSSGKRAATVVSSTASGVTIKREEHATRQKSSRQVQTRFISSTTPQQHQQELVDCSALIDEVKASSIIAPGNYGDGDHGQQVANYHCHQYSNTTISTNSGFQHDDYASCYYGDDGGNDSYSPPQSPLGVGEGNNYCDISSTHLNESKSVAPSSPPPPVVKTKRTPKKRQKGLKRQSPKAIKPIKPRGPRKSETGPVRDAICDECGLKYNKLYLSAHKNQMHNPNYDGKTRTCRLCSVVYKSSQRWYTHYLRDHAKSRPEAERSHICEECGSTYFSKSNLVKHQYFSHGEGQNKDNYIPCPICPEKTFKGKVGYNAHLQRYHPDMLSLGLDCYRCGEKFSNWVLIREHVKFVHPESHFPCPYCTVTKFSQLGLYFHFRRCTKINGAQRNEMRRKCEKEGNVFSLEEMRLPCEYCERMVIVSGLTRHFKEFHNVTEDKFTCSVCQKRFTTRGFWANHLEEKHQWPVDDDFKELLRKLNAVNKEGLTTIAKRSQYARPSESRLGGRKRKTKAETTGKGSGGGRRKKGRMSKCDNSSSSESEEEVQQDDVKEALQEWDSDNDQKRNVKKKRRKITVIAEEDEMGY